jgi:hypothetical protein
MVKSLNPSYLRLKGKWWVHGGIYTTVVCEHRKKGWILASRVAGPEYESDSPMRGKKAVAFRGLLHKPRDDSRSFVFENQDK